MEYDLQLAQSTLRVFHQKNYPNRPTIVFLHDSLGCIRLWRDFPQKLGEATQCNVLVYDRQGYGKSSGFTIVKRGLDYLELEADILSELLEKCGIDQAILLGHSDGGTIALIAAAKYPIQVVAIITEGAHVFVENITLKGIQKAVLTYRTSNLKEKLTKYHTDKTDAVFKAWTETWLTSEFRHWDVTHFLPQITCPALIIQGANDEFGTVKQVDAIVEQTLGKAVKLMIPAIGHSPHKEAEEITIKAIKRFINRQP